MQDARYPEGMFEKLEEAGAGDVIVRPSLTYWQDAWRRFRRNGPAMVSAAVLLIMVLACIVIPFFWPYTYEQQERTNRNKGPSIEHVLGTDNYGRDVFIRVVYGARISLSIGLVASLINLTIGVLYGGISGFAGGKVDMVMMRIVEVLDSIPLLLYVIMLQMVFEEPIKDAFANVAIFKPLQKMGPQLFLIYIVLGSVYWVTMAHMVRGQILSIKNQEFVMAAKVQGASFMRIIFTHLIPNAVGSIIVLVTMAIPSAIFTESFLSFIGAGVNAPMPSWGSMASDAYSSIASFPHLLFAPAGAICISVLAFNLMGDGLRDALDPKMRK